MSPGFSDDLLKVDDNRKTAIINRERKRLNIDTAALQETRFPQTAISGMKTTPCFGREESHRNNGCMGLDLQ